MVWMEEFQAKNIKLGLSQSNAYLKTALGEAKAS